MGESLVAAPLTLAVALLAVALAPAAGSFVPAAWSVAGSGAFVRSQTPAEPPAPAIPATGVPALGGLVAGFVENAGQLGDSSIRYYASAGGLLLGFGGSSVTTVLRTAEGAVAVRLTFPGSADVLPAGRGELPGRSHFYLGNDPAGWRTNVRAFQEVVYEGLYEGIDLVYTFTPQGAKYTFELAASAEVDRIGLRYEGARSVAPSDGGLLVETALGTFRDAAPVAFAEDGSPVRCGFSLDGGDAGFSCTGWGGESALAIDPLVYSTLLGGNATEVAYAVAVDADGNAYTTGYTESLDFPATVGVVDETYNNNTDVYVAKLNATGTALLWATYLGGNATDQGIDLALDGLNQTYLTGLTESADFPTTVGANDTVFNGTQDAFVVKLNETGSALLYATYLGGNESEVGQAIAVDASGNAFVAGSTDSNETTFPVTPGAFNTTFAGGYDAFVAKLNDTGSALLYATYLGGSGDEVAYGLAVDASGNAYVAGQTGSTDFPVTAGAFQTVFGGPNDAFVAKLNDTGSALLYGTYLGGSVDDYAYRALAVDASGNAYVAGYTTSSADFPVTAGAFQTVFGGSTDAFVAKLNDTGSALLYGTYLGGSGDDYAYALAVDASGSVYVAGTTSSSDYPVTGGAHDEVFNGTTDAFVTKLGALSWPVTVDTDPTGLALEVGGMPQTAPYTFWCGGDSNVTLNTSSPQVLGTERYAFANWSDGGNQTHDILCTGPATYVANFTLSEYWVVVDTAPTNQTVWVDGVNYTSPAGFWWAPNSTHNLSAESYVTIANDTRLAFTGWSDGGNQTHNVTISAAGNFTAYYNTTEYWVSVGTNPTGLDFMVDTVAYNATTGFWWVDGTNHTLNTTDLQGAFPWDYYDFVNWSDGDNATDRNYTTTGPANVTAGFEHYFTVNVTTNPVGFNFSVNGTDYNSTQSFVWLEGTNHTLNTTTPQLNGTGVSFDFVDWTDGGAINHTATATMPFDYVATFAANVSYWITVETVPAGRDITVDGNPFTAPYSFSCVGGTNFTVGTDSPQVVGFTRYVWTNWSDVGAQNHTVDCTAAMTITAYFTTQYNVAIITLVGLTPVALTLLIDSVPIPSPVVTWWNASSQHTIGTDSPQVVGGVTRYLWASWSDAGAQNHTVTATAPGGWFAFFDEEHLITVDSIPTGLDVTVDTATAPGPQAVWWVNGTLLSVSTPSPQTFGRTRYVWSAWSDGGARTHSFTVTGPLWLNATFVTQYEVIVDTVPANLVIVVDTVTLSAPQTFWWVDGSPHTVDTLTPQGAGTTRNRFVGWSDGGAKSHGVSPAGPMDLVAVFQTEHQFTVTTSPGNLQVTVDGNDAVAPYTAWCPDGSTVALDVPSPQVSGQIEYAFASWSDSGTKSHSVNCAAATFTATLTASRYGYTILTNPPGLEVLVDSVLETSPATGWWTAGVPHDVEAPSPQTYGASEWTFASWSDSGARAHQVTPSAPVTLTATFTETTTPGGGVPDFGISVSPPLRTTSPNSSVTYTVTVTSVNGYAAPPVGVSLLTAPAGVTGSCSPASVTPPSSCTLTVDVGASVAADVYTLTVRGSNGTANRDYSVVLEVVAPGDFDVVASPATATAPAGGSATYTVVAVGLAGYTGPDVAISLVSPPAGITGNCSPTTLTPTETCVLAASVASTVAAGTYTLTVRGDNGVDTREDTVTLVVTTVTTGGSFTVEATQASVTVDAGETTTITVTVTPSGGFTGPVAITVTGLPSGVGYRVSPESVITTGTATITLVVDSDAPDATATITITGRSGSASDPDTVQVIVNAVEPQQPTVQVLPAWVLPALLGLLVALILVALLPMLRKRKKCPKCGMKVSGSAKFCEHCGTDLAERPAAPAGPAAPPAEPKPAAPAEQPAEGAPPPPPPPPGWAPETQETQESSETAEEGAPEHVEPQDTGEEPQPSEPSPGGFPPPPPPP